MKSKKTPTQVSPTQASEQDAGKGAIQRTQQIGEGSYEGTRDYQKSVETYLEDADVAADAKAAKPANPAEADELKRAEEEGLSPTKSKGQ